MQVRLDQLLQLPILSLILTQWPTKTFILRTRGCPFKLLLWNTPKDVWSYSTQKPTVIHHDITEPRRPAIDFGTELFRRDECLFLYLSSHPNWASINTRDPMDLLSGVSVVLWAWFMGSHHCILFPCVCIPSRPAVCHSRITGTYDFCSFSFSSSTLFIPGFLAVLCLCLVLCAYLLLFFYFIRTFLPTQSRGR